MKEWISKSTKPRCTAASLTYCVAEATLTVEAGKRGRIPAGATAKPHLAAFKINQMSLIYWEISN